VPPGTVIFLDVSTPIPDGYVLIGTVSVDVKLAGATSLTTGNGGSNLNGTKHVTLNVFQKAGSTTTSSSSSTTTKLTGNQKK
jgi:hypothetical protein